MSIIRIFATNINDMINFSKRNLIGFAGTLGSGKDTAADILNYQRLQGTYATYKAWKELHDSNYRPADFPVIHFGDTLKAVISIVFNIPLEDLNNRDKKDNGVYCFDTRKIIDFNIAVRKCYYIIDFDNFVAYGIPLNTTRVCVKVRHLMQAIGTNLFRNNLSQNIWVDNVMFYANNCINRNGLCFIPDVRFQNEVDAILNKGGVVYRINRFEPKDNETAHESERINELEGCIDIDNKTTLLSLYYKMYDIMRKELI